MSQRSSFQQLLPFFSSPPLLSPTMATMQRSALRSTTSVRGGARVGAVSAAPVRRVAGRRGVAARAEKVREEKKALVMLPPALSFFVFAFFRGFLDASRGGFRVAASSIDVLATPSNRRAKRRGHRGSHRP